MLRGRPPGFHRRSVFRRSPITFDLLGRLLGIKHSRHRKHSIELCPAQGWTGILQRVVSDIGGRSQFPREDERTTSRALLQSLGISPEEWNKVCKSGLASPVVETTSELTLSRTGKGIAVAVGFPEQLEGVMLVSKAYWNAGLWIKYFDYKSSED